jgi:DnaJ-class molecular chaperone
MTMKPDGGEEWLHECPRCGGWGYVTEPVELNGKTEGVAFIQTKCPTCGGTGRKHRISPKPAA